ncbi:MAG: hypothetical protein CEE40_09295 [Chloroflexi bacterium B3_Chlor]|nr:MAG: hypothetical protein CEE40_09295 [Chloroflexi bacterium B3_Chlor]
MRRFFCLSFAILGTCVVMLGATLLAQASSLSRVGVWWTPQEVSQSDNKESRGPDIAVDDGGYLHLIWMDDTPGQFEPCYVESENQGSSWSDVEPVPTTSDSSQGALAVGSGDTLHACWWERTAYPVSYTLLYARRTAGAWGVEGTVVVTDSDLKKPSIAEAGNYVHVVWSNKLQPHYDLYYSRKLVNGNEWLTPTVIADTSSSSLYGRMAADTNGNLHLVWHENTSPNEVMYISATVDAVQTTWFSPITVSADLSLDASTPDIVLGDGLVHIAFGVDVADQDYTYDVYYAKFPISNTDTMSPSVLPNSTVRVSRELPTYAGPSVALDDQDRVHVVWNGVTGTDTWDRIYYAVSEDQGASWSQPIAISRDDEWPDGFPTIATYGTLAHVAWQQKGTGYDHDIYYSHSLPYMKLFPLALKDYS